MKKKMKKKLKTLTRGMKVITGIQRGKKVIITLKKKRIILSKVVTLVMAILVIKKIIRN